MGVRLLNTFEHLGPMNVKVSEELFTITEAGP